MPPFPQDLVGGVHRGLQGHCHVLLLELRCWSCSNSLLACFSLPPSHIFWVSINSTQWYFLFSVVLTGAWRWAVARLPWWPPYYWGDCCPPLLLPLRHLPSNIQLAWSLKNNLRNKLDITEIIDIFTCEDIISSHMRISYRFYLFVTTRYTTCFVVHGPLTPSVSNISLSQFHFIQ